MLLIAPGFFYFYIMALDIKFYTQLDYRAENVWIIDNTGEYDAANNEGGWGAPNPELSESALLALARVNTSEGYVNLTPVGSNLVHDNVALNSKINSFQFAYVTDGWHEYYLYWLAVSDDGVSDINGRPLAEGEYFYYRTLLKLYKIESGTAVEVTDASEIIGKEGTTFTLCEKLEQGKLSMKRASYYSQYKSERNTACDTTQIMNKTRTLTEDIISNDYDFRVGMKTQAQTNVEYLLDVHNVN